VSPSPEHLVEIVQYTAGIGRAASGCERERPNKSVLREVYAPGGKSPLVNASVQCSKSTKGEGSIGAMYLSYIIYRRDVQFVLKMKVV